MRGPKGRGNLSPHKEITSITCEIGFVLRNFGFTTWRFGFPATGWRIGFVLHNHPFVSDFGLSISGQRPAIGFVLQNGTGHTPPAPPPAGGFLCVTSVGQDLGVLGHDVRLSIEYTLAHGYRFALDCEQWTTNDGL